MLLCPEPTQTSPTRTSWIVVVLIVISIGPPVTSGLSHAAHLPLAAGV